MGQYEFTKHTHDTPLLLGKGELWGLPGEEHSKRFKDFDLNILLTEQYIPKRPFTSGMGVNLPPAPSGEKIIAYMIRDGRPPASDAYLKWMLSQMEIALLGGKKVAVSCFGGHGRTGTLLGLVYSLFRDDDPIRAVRDTICPQCIESQEQIEFLFSYHNKPLPEQYVFIPKPRGEVVDWTDWSKDKWWAKEDNKTGYIDPWLDPKIRVQFFEKDGVAFDFDEDELSELPNGEVIGELDGHCVPAIRVEGKWNEQLVKGGIVRFNCDKCFEEMALSPTVENAIVCTNCKEERTLPKEWKGYKFALHLSK